jgi:hypothetical protein
MWFILKQKKLKCKTCFMKYFRIPKGMFLHLLPQVGNILALMLCNIQLQYRLKTLATEHIWKRE